MTDSPLERLKAHYADRIRGVLESCEVELGPGETLTVYFRPGTTMAQQAAILSHSNPADQVVETVLQCALNEDGTRMFKKADRLELLKEIDSRLLNTLCLKMRLAEPDLDEAGKS